MSAAMVVDLAVWLIALSALAGMFFLGRLHGRFVERRAQVKVVIDREVGRAVRDLIPSQRSGER